ncbi:MAG TPA: hypothetical protein PKN70_11885 [Smithellaceae bacterium]|nr:hypothetical protein [Smithellaceae bacterium]
MNFDNIPKELKLLNNFVLWKKETIPGRDKPTKIPYQANGHKAMSNNPQTWCSFDEAVRAFEAGRFSGIGFQFSNSPFTGVDLDGCCCSAFKDVPGVGVLVNKWAAEIVKEAKTYTEVTQSGRGLHLLFEGKLPEGIDGFNTRLSDDGTGVEAYSKGRFFVLTGNHLQGSPKVIHKRPSILEKLYQTHAKNVTKQSEIEDPHPQRQAASVNLKDSELLEKAFASTNGGKIRALYNGDHSAYPSQSEADLALCQYLSFWTGGDHAAIARLFRASGLFRKKCDERHSSSGETYLQTTIRRACENQKSYYDPNYHSGESSMADREETPDEKKRPPQAEILLQIADKILTLFHDQNKEPYCFVNNRAYSLRASAVKDILSYRYYQQEGRAPNAEALKQCITTLRGKAIFEARSITLHNRIASADGAFWYDMGAGTVLKITRDKWEVNDKFPIMFRSYSTQGRQVTPDPDGNLMDVFQFLNVAEEHQHLVAVYLVSAFVPDIAHPLCHPYGAHGSGKTTFAKVLKKLIDPSPIEAMIMQRDYAQLIQSIAHHHFVPFDNLSDLPSWASDVLAVAVTGGGLSKRTLFTDEDDTVLSVRRVISINAINLLIQRADLMDRAILLHLDRIRPSRRMDETAFWVQFEQKKAGILGGIFNTLVRALRFYSDVSLATLPRMADFAKWGYAIGEAIKSGGGQEFLNSYVKNIQHQHEEIVQSNTMILAILKEMDGKDQWSATIKEAFTRLREVAIPDKDDPTFPKTDRTLRKHMERAKTTLEQQGISFNIGRRTATGIPLTLKRTASPEYTNFASFSSFDTQNANNDNNSNTYTNEAKQENSEANTFGSLSSSLNEANHEANEHDDLSDTLIIHNEININEANVSNEANFPHYRKPPKKYDLTGEHIEVIP